MRQLRIDAIAWLPSGVRELGRYALIELLLPGGSLIALGLWAFRHRAVVAARAPRLGAMVAALFVSLALPEQTMAHSGTSFAIATAGLNTLKCTQSEVTDHVQKHQDAFQL